MRQSEIARARPRTSPAQREASKIRSQSKHKGESYLKRPKNPFLLFCQDCREENDKSGGSPLTMKVLSKEWEEVSESKKKKKKKMFDEANDEYKEKKKEINRKEQEKDKEKEERRQ